MYMRMEHRLTGTFAGVSPDVKSRDAGVIGLQTLACAMHESIGGIDFCRVHIEVVTHMPPGNNQAVALRDGIIVL